MLWRVHARSARANFRPQGTLIQLGFKSGQNTQKTHLRIHILDFFFVMEDRLEYAKSHLKSTFCLRVPPNLECKLSSFTARPPARFYKKESMFHLIIWIIFAAKLKYNRFMRTVEAF